MLDVGYWMLDVGYWIFLNVKQFLKLQISNIKYQTSIVNVRSAQKILAKFIDGLKIFRNL
ncbi:MAG: hypothetical protein A3H98_00135 [Bacteroidetes bacterium RIFCSPLOWO2_02_FULL_36_8]|nr:MAG: hypothetical protein A3H98_00135 [Bacteroidetes bacterium RIFCSPLOWO2_02_FULL_36_8]